jgi:hypothetical protein
MDTGAGARGKTVFFWARTILNFVVFSCALDPPGGFKEPHRAGSTLNSQILIGLLPQTFLFFAPTF